MWPHETRVGDEFVDEKALVGYRAQFVVFGPVEAGGRTHAGRQRNRLNDPHLESKIRYAYKKWPSVRHVKPETSEFNRTSEANDSSGM